MSVDLYGLLRRIGASVVGGVALAMLLALASATSSSAAPHYTTTFSGGAGAEWSPQSVETAPSSERFLGVFDNTTATLTLTGLPAHTGVIVGWDLYVLRTWDGDSTSAGPDFWEASVVGGPELQSKTTFACPFGGYTQSYPDPYPAASPNAPGTGSAAQDTLGYGSGCDGDFTYTFSRQVEHSGSTLTVAFTGSNLQGWTDEGWGLDNVSVELVGVTTPPAATECRVHANGKIAGRRKFALEGKVREGRDPKGNAHFKDHESGFELKAAQVTGVSCSGNEATLTGVRRVKRGASSNFRIRVVDNGRHGSPAPDSFSIEADGYSASGPLVKGDVKVKRRARRARARG